MDVCVKGRSIKLLEVDSEAVVMWGNHCGEKS